MKITADTLGWDTIFAVRMSEANRHIDIARVSPDGFTASVKDYAGLTLVVDFATWQLSPKSSGSSAVMMLPLKTCRILAADGTEKISLNGAVAHVRVAMEFIVPDLIEHAPEDAVRHHLKLAPPESRNFHPVEVSKLELPDGAPDDVTVNMVVQSELERWLNVNLAAFDHVFAELDVTSKTAKGHFAWMMPTDMVYSFAEAESEADGVLAVLCMTGGRDKGDLSTFVSSDVIRSDSLASIVISSRRMIADVITPMISRSIPGVRPNGFVMDSDGMGMQLRHPMRIDVPRRMFEQRESMIDRLDLRIAGDHLSIGCEIETRTIFGMISHRVTEGAYELVLAENDKGEQVLRLKKLSSGFEYTWVEETPTLKAIKIGAAVLAGVMGLAALASGGAAAGLAIGIAVVASVLILMVDVEELRIKDIAPAFAHLMDIAGDTLVWGAREIFELTDVDLSDSFRLNGRLQAPVTT